jgi:cell filamentation protein
MHQYYYEYEHDGKYWYPNSNTLMNKLNIRDDKTLLEAERNITAIRILELRQKALKGKLDYRFLCKLHKYIFRDIYTWAGKIRAVDISKGNMFCKSEYIYENADVIFKQLEKDNYLIGINETEISTKLAYYMSEINTPVPRR